MDSETRLTAQLILQIHQQAFGRLYEWSGKWRTSNFQVGNHTPPDFSEVPTRMYQFIDELNFRLKRNTGENDLIKTLAYAHHQFVFIHPFNNGNGRTARLLTNLIALLSGYDHIVLYHRDGDARKTYLKAIQAADNTSILCWKR